MLWICHDSSNNHYRFGVSNYSTSQQLFRRPPVNFETNILRILFNGYVKKIGFVERFINIDSFEHHRIMLEEKRNGSYFQ